MSSIIGGIANKNMLQMPAMASPKDKIKMEKTGTEYGGIETGAKFKADLTESLTKAISKLKLKAQIELKCPYGNTADWATFS